MDSDKVSNSQSSSTDRGYAVSMIINSFKGHSNVEVHLFRPFWPPEEEEIYNWEEILGGAVSPDRPLDREKAKRVFMETFNSRESEHLMDYLWQRYGSRLASVDCAELELPVPLDLVPLCDIGETEYVGILSLDRISSYPLDFPVRGVYDLSRHDPA